MKSYTFHFDESFHDKKIRINENGQFNILREDALDNYIGVFWGCPTSELASNRKIIQKFENRQKLQYGLTEEQEFKSTVIAKKNFKYGIRSFNKVTMTFYKELFELIDILNPVIQVNMVSKMELYLRLAFKGLHYFGQGELLEKSFFYTLTKFMMTYGLFNDEGVEEDTVTNIRKIGENDLASKRILSENWFDIDIKQFELYHLLYDVLIIGHTEYWTAMTMSYNDQCSSFYTLLRYFSTYDNYEKYRKIDAKLHSEYFNSACCMELERSYQDFYKF